MRFILRGLRLLRSNPRLFFWRLRTLLRRPVHNSQAILASRVRHERIETEYAAWLQISQTAPLPEPASYDVSPLISIIMPVHDVDQALLVAAIDSVRRQSYGSWELCIADDASTQSHISETLREYAERDARIRVVYRAECGHISAASNSALALATGEFIVLLDHDDVLAPDALARVADVIAQDAEVDLIYSDEDKLDMAGTRSQPFFKPAWSPVLLTSCNYITHLAAVRRSLVLEVGKFRHETVGSQDHDLLLRVSERARKVAHLPCVLYSWRMAPHSTARASSAKPYAVEAARRALDDSIVRRGIDARIEQSHLNGIYMLRHRLPPALPVSLIVVGTDDAWRDVLMSEGITVREVVFLGRQQSVPPSTVVAPNIDSLTAEYLLWVDASSRPTTPNEPAALLEHLQQPDVAVVGGTTRLADGTVLQAGITVGDGGQPHFAYAGLDMLPQSNFYLNLKDLPHEVSATYVGCCAVRRETWQGLQGWRRDLPPSLAMCDFCLRALEAGYRNVYTPLARFESKRVLIPLPNVDTCQWPWREYHDPYWNPNFNPASPEGLPLRWQTHMPARILHGCMHRM